MLALPEWTSTPHLMTLPHAYQRPTRIRRPAALLRLWARRVAQRNALSAMTLRDLRDIGITRSEALNEASKPFWQG